MNFQFFSSDARCAEHAGDSVQKMCGHNCIQSSCPMLMKKFSSLHQKVPNNAKESLRHRIKSYKLQLHLYIRNLQI